MSTSIFVAMTTTGGIVKQRTCVSLFQMAVNLAGAGIQCKLVSVDGPHIPENRDVLTDLFMRSEASHLLFVDSDMAFDPGLCQNLLSFEKEIIGAIYTQRNLNLDRMKKALAKGHSFDEAYALGHSYLTSSVKQIGELCDVDYLGMGFVLISRSAIDKVKAGCSLRTYKYSQTELRGYFDPIRIEDRVLGEDKSFFHRWTKELGQRLYAYPDADIFHIGEMAYGVKFRTLLSMKS